MIHVPRVSGRVPGVSGHASAMSQRQVSQILINAMDFFMFRAGMCQHVLACASMCWHVPECEQGHVRMGWHVPACASMCQHVISTWNSGLPRAPEYLEYGDS